MRKSDVLAKLNTLSYNPEEYWVVAGAAMVLYGLREETYDVDLGCTSAMADRLETEGFPCQRTADGNRRFKVDEETEIFENWLYDTVVMPDGIPVISLEGLVTMKRLLGREKDLRDIRLIEEYGNHQ